MVTQCDELVYTPVNALTFKITGNTLCLKPVYNKNKNIIKKHYNMKDACFVPSGRQVRSRSLEYGCPGAGELENHAPGA